MNNLQPLRLTLRMSRQEFAGRLGVYAEYIADMEASERRLSPVWTEAVVAAFGVSPEVFEAPFFDGRSISDRHPLPEARRFACPIALRYGLMTLIAKSAGLDSARSLKEDQIADAVISLNAYVAESADDGSSSRTMISRLSKALQITSLTMLQSGETGLREDFERTIEAASSPLAQLILELSDLP